MIYRKGEVSASLVDTHWPHQVAVRATTVQGKANGEIVEEFCLEGTLCPTKVNGALRWR